MFRFDVVILNYNRLYCFFNNFGRICGFDKDRDRITCVTSSASKEEKQFFYDFCKTNCIKNYRYIAHRNFGMAEKARLDFFSGKTGGVDNFNSEYVFQMQEHYLAIDDPCSIWGADYNYAVKGDVVPDNVLFDLDEIEKLFKNHNLSTLYADRGKPMVYAIGNKWFIAPNGGNFIVRTELLPSLKKIFMRLRATCDGTYHWALFMEYFWGELFFEEGSKTYDYEHRQLFSNYRDALHCFKEGNENYYSLRNGYLCPRFYPDSKQKITLKLLFSEKGKNAAKRIVFDFFKIARYKFFAR